MEHDEWVLAERLRKTARASRDAEEEWGTAREARDAVVIAADDAGWRLRAIARAAGLSLSHVQRIVVEQTARRQDALEPKPETD